MILLICVLLYYAVLDEVETDPPSSDSSYETFIKILKKIKGVILKPRNFFLIAEYTLATSFYYSVLMWYPYYFSLIGFPNSSSTIAMIYLITYTVGTVLF